MHHKNQVGNTTRPQIKVCGLTRIAEAIGCAMLGVDAIGFVFYAKSPRNVAPEMARKIVGELPKTTFPVGVFVDESFDQIMKTVDTVRLRGVQLHGLEPPELVDRLRKENLLVIKGLFINRKPFIHTAPDYAASAFLVECGRGKLPGGNAEIWDYQTAGTFGKAHPFILAGGLTVENVLHAVHQSLPDAVDVSSGVEVSPGRKDLKKVGLFVKKLKEIELNHTFRRIFYDRHCTTNGPTD